MNRKILATFSSCRCRGFCCCCWSPDTKTQWHGYFFLLLLLWILATCCCYEYEVWLPFPSAGPRIGKHHCSGKTPWQWRTEKPQNCSPKIPNVTSETYRKWWFWRLFLLAAMNFGYLFLLPLQRLLLLLLLVPAKASAADRKTPWRTEKPQNCTPKMPNVTSETHRKWWF